MRRPGKRPKVTGSALYWPWPTHYPVANERRYLRLFVALGSMRGEEVMWRLDDYDPPAPYTGPLRAYRRRGYTVRLTREGVALWPTYAPEPELADPHAHPVECLRPTKPPPRR